MGLPVSRHSSSQKNPGLSPEGLNDHGEDRRESEPRTMIDPTYGMKSVAVRWTTFA